MNRIKRNVVVAVMMAMAMGTEDHEWQVWRKSLHEFAQYLFK